MFAPTQKHSSNVTYKQKIMNIDTNSDVCIEWLKSTLNILKSDQVDGVFQNENLIKVSEELTDALYTRDIETAKSICQRHLNHQNTSTSNIKDLILPTIYAVENEWTTGRRSFSETVLAFWQVQMLLEYDANFFEKKTSYIENTHQGHIVFAAAPGCDHNLGVLVLSDFFRAYGWHVCEIIEDSSNAIANEISNHSTDFLGISVGHDEALVGLADQIKNIRVISKNPSLKIILGGNVFDMNSTEYDWIGADYIASSPNDALQYCTLNNNKQSLVK